MKLILILIFALWSLVPGYALANEQVLSPEEIQLLEQSLAADLHSNEHKSSPASKPLHVHKIMPDIAFILDVAYADFGGKEPLQLGAHDPGKAGFNLQQLEMSLSAEVDPFFRFNANLVFTQFGVETEEAYVTTTALPWKLQGRAGQFLTKFGRMNGTHPHTWHFVDQALVLGKFFGGEGSRGTGVELSWLSPLPWYTEVVVSATEAAGECCARSFLGGDDPGVRDMTDHLYTTAVKQFFSLNQSWSMLWGLSGQFGPNSTGKGNRTDIFGTDVYFRYRPLNSSSRESFSVQLEWLQRHRQVPDELLQDQGGYLHAIWQWDPHWEVGMRYEQVDGVENDPLDPEWNEPRRRTALQLTYYPSHFSRVRFQGAQDAPEWLDEPMMVWFVALEVLVGAHGAHPY